MNKFKKALSEKYIRENNCSKKEGYNYAQALWTGVKKGLWSERQEEKRAISLQKASGNL